MLPPQKLQLVPRMKKITKKILWQALVYCHWEGPIHPQTPGQEKIQNYYLSPKHSQLYTQNNQHDALILELPSKLKSIANYSRNQQISVFPISRLLGISHTLVYSYWI